MIFLSYATAVLIRFQQLKSVLRHFSGAGFNFVTPSVQEKRKKQKNIVDAWYFLVTQPSQSYYGLGASTWYTLNSCLI